MVQIILFLILTFNFPYALVSYLHLPFTIHICHRHGNWVKEKMERFRCIYLNRGSGVDAGRCADEWQQFQCRCAVVFLLEDQSR